MRLFRRLFSRGWENLWKLLVRIFLGMIYSKIDSVVISYPEDSDIRSSHLETRIDCFPPELRGWVPDGYTGLPRRDTPRKDNAKEYDPKTVRQETLSAFLANHCPAWRSFSYSVPSRAVLKAV